MVMAFRFIPNIGITPAVIKIAMGREKLAIIPILPGRKIRRKITTMTRPLRALLVKTSRRFSTFADSLL